jgi:hypothetical protein
VSVSVCVCVCVCVYMYLCMYTYIYTHTYTSRSRDVRRMTAERCAQFNRKTEAYAAAVEQARGRSARHRAPHAGIHGCAHLARARHATAPSVVRSGTGASTCRARRARSAAAVGASARVCCCAAPAQRGRNNTFRGHAHVTHDALRMHLPAHSLMRWCRRPNL